MDSWTALHKAQNGLLHIQGPAWLRVVGIQVVHLPSTEDEAKRTVAQSSTQTFKLFQNFHLGLQNRRQLKVLKLKHKMLCAEGLSILSGVRGYGPFLKKKALDSGWCILKSDGIPVTEV